MVDARKGFLSCLPAEAESRTTTWSSLTHPRPDMRSTCFGFRSSSRASHRQGYLRRDAARAVDMFRDPERAGAVLVTLPEYMPASETVELADALSNELGIPVLQLVINRVLSVLFAEKERPVLESLPSELAGDSEIPRAGHRRKATRASRNDSGSGGSAGMHPHRRPLQRAALLRRSRERTRRASRR